MYADASIISVINHLKLIERNIYLSSVEETVFGQLGCFFILPVVFTSAVQLLGQFYIISINAHHILCC